MRVVSLCILCCLLILPLPAQGVQVADREDDGQIGDSLAESSDKKWRVNAAHGPVDTVRFSTDEGTWMNLSVSPDGRDIVFDLLGDLYTIPITGGRAKRLSFGPALDVQPAFSPDGTQIAFTSDRGGGDNIWVMNRDGSEPRQISKESFRLPNGPAWTPDGQFILARKHFTSTRSLGAGEVWMYHISGGSGLQLTERKNDQQDQANEIALSPDGRFVYFSEDLTPGSSFQYNKDPNTGIYGIRRLDRETGELETLISGSGGAARPTPSPDGRTVAFVRRVREKSVLYLYDVESGTARPIYDELDFDQQEVWAIFGVYPSMDWTPDGRSIVFWAGGKIRKIDVESREVTEIPFEADVEQAVTEAIRFTVEVLPETFTSMMITDAVTSPDGVHLVFNAVGRLWKMRLPDGRPVPLSKTDSRFEYEPSFSPDGSTIVFTTWHDEELGAIRTINIDGTGETVLTTRKGYYFEPRFSPSGDRIIFRRGEGNLLLGNAHGTETGLFWMPAGGGPDMHEIGKDGTDARFDPTGERVYFQEGGGLEKKYKSVRLDGGDERTHFTMKYATDVVPSPDGEWVAFTELFNAYVMPFPRTGRAVELSKDQVGVPVRQVSRDAGTDLHWSSDSRMLHWILGPAYFNLDLSDTFSFVDEASDELPAIDTTGLPAIDTTGIAAIDTTGLPAIDTTGTVIALDFATDVPSGLVAFTGGRIVTMKGEEIIEDGTLLVHGNRIAGVGPSDDVVVPDEAHVVDVSGMTILPGMIDVHAHASHFHSGPSPQQNWPYFANLAYGVTTIHDPSARTDFVFRQSELQKAGRIVAPRIFSTGRILYGAEGDFKAVVDSLGDARSHLRRLKSVGASTVKSYNQPRRDQRQQILAAARDLELMVVPEGGSTFFHNLTQIIDGHTGIEHNLPVAPLYRDVIELWRHTDVGYTPTLVVNYGGPNGEYWWYEHTDVWAKDRLLSFVPRPLIDTRSRRPTKIPDEEYQHLRVAAQAKKLVDQGNLVQIGGHGQLQGLAAHWELWMLHQGGMSPLEALRSATLHGAKYLGLDRDIGSLEPGKLADLFVVAGNPLEDLYATENVEMVMINGRLFDAATMNQIGNHPRERKPFYWERENVDDRFIWLPSHMLEHAGGSVCSHGTP